MFSTSKFALFAVASAALASANPIGLASRQAGICTPVFSGAQTIFLPVANPAIVGEWLPDSDPATVGGHVNLISKPVDQAFAVGEFLVEQVGHPDPTFIIKYAADTSLALSGNGNDLKFARLPSGSPDKSLQFMISCNTCPSPGAGQHDQEGTGCTIQNVETGTCVTVGNTLTLQKCSDAEQSFSFIN